MYAEAQEAIAVKICTRGLRGENDCVESNPMSFPIMNVGPSPSTMGIVKVPTDHL